ncbi:MAG: CRTAC1 family protein [Planctomycetota bacterium]
MNRQKIGSTTALRIYKSATVSLWLLTNGLWGCDADVSREPTQGSIAFDEVTDQVGISYQGPSYGASWGDFNGDGLPDLWASGHAPYILYLNLGNGTFSDIGPQVTKATGTDRHGAAWADVDGDGDQDLLQLNGANRGHGSGANNLLINQGRYFGDRAAAAGLAYPEGRGRTPVWLDYDADGLLDVILNNAERAEAPTALFRRTQAWYKNVTELAGLTQVRHSEFSLLGHLTGNSTVHVVFGPPFPAALYAILPTGLENITESCGIPPAWATDAVLADFNNDLLVDVFAVRGDLGDDVAQVAESALLLRLQVPRGAQEIRFQTERAVTFDMAPVQPDWWSEATVFIGSAGLHPTSFPFTLTSERPDAQGLTETGGADKGVYVGYEEAEGSWCLRLKSAAWEEVVARITSARPITKLERIGLPARAPAYRPRLYLNEGGHFRDASSQVGLPEGANVFSIGAGDFDNDMDVDLYLVCSGELVNSDNILLENQGDGVFRNVLHAGGAVGSAKGLGDCVALADYDRDGFLDLFVTNGRNFEPLAHGPHQLYRNRGNSNHWLEIDLVGVKSNRDGIGARVVVTTGGITQVRSQDNGMHCYTQNFKRLHVGLAQHLRVERIVVEWPSGTVQALEEVAADQILSIVEQED